MSTDFVRASRVVVVVVALTACAATQQHVAEATPAKSEWTTSALQASQEASAGRYAVADKVLVDYATRYPASADAPEAVYWRALYKLDPANSAATPREAVVLLDGYLASGPVTHRAEAQTLRRVAAALEARAAGAPPRADEKPRDEELARLKDELAKANAELERIKRRLAQPKP